MSSSELKVFIAGEDILASDTNDNNQYLKNYTDSAIATVSATLGTTNTNLANLTSTVNTLDTGVVKTTGNQTVEGIKTFNDTIYFPICSNAATTNSSASIQRLCVITENYKNGDSWARKYSDGWIEQGGKSTKGTGDTTVTFTKEYTNTPTILITEYETGGAHATVTCVKSASKDKFTWSSASGVDAIYWQACGY